MKTFKLSLIVVFLVLTSSKNKSEELFEGEAFLKDCYVYIPLTYTRANDKKVTEKAKELVDKELILLQFSKKNKEVYFKRYYLVSDQSDDHTIFNYLVEPGNYEAHKKGDIKAVFLKFTPKYDRFYISSCFDSTMNQHKELLAKWKGK